MNAHSEIDEDEKPLDPATERVAGRLKRFGAVFMGLNMLALMAVLGAIVYKIGGFGEEEKAPPAASVTAGVPIDPGFEAGIDIPDGATLISANQSGANFILAIRLADGASEVWIFDTASRQVTGKLRLY